MNSAFLKLAVPALAVFSSAFFATLALAIALDHPRAIIPAPAATPSGTTAGAAEGSGDASAASAGASGAALTAPAQNAPASDPAAAAAPFIFSFNAPGTLEEAPSASQSTSPYWFLDSGGEFIIQNGVGATLQGPLPPGSRWQSAYARNNPLDTGGGAYPQNLFRLITKRAWDSMTEQVSFKITALNQTDTPNRGGYSGVLLMSHYRDENNLYYAGVRQDGTAVIKKKTGGVYYTLAQAPVWPGVYDESTNPDLIPMNRWMTLRLQTQDEGGGTVELTLWLDDTGAGAWRQLLAARDTKGGADGPAIAGPAPAGIRTDYMDVLFSNFRVTAS